MNDVTATVAIVSLAGAAIALVWFAGIRLDVAALSREPTWRVSPGQLICLIAVSFSGLMARIFPAQEFFFLLPTLLFMGLASLTAYTLASLIPSESVLHTIGYQAVFHLMIFFQIYLCFVVWRSYRRSKIGTRAGEEVG